MTEKRKLEWIQSWDDHDNPVWEADSVYVEDDHGPSFKWRLELGVRGGELVWLPAHDLELLSPDNAHVCWSSLEKAKAEIEREHVESIEDVFGEEASRV